MSRLGTNGLPCESEGCTERATFHLSWTELQRCYLAQHLCEEHAKPVLTSHDLTTPIGQSQRLNRDRARGFDPYLLVITEIHDQQAIYLKETDGKGFLPILIGIFEATAIDRILKGMRAPRPLTHDALASVIRSLHGELMDVLIDELDVDNHAYHAKLRIQHDNQLILVDTRPSDAFAIALLFQAPIFIADAVITKLNANPPTDK
jgi:uncharacterized protein